MGYVSGVFGVKGWVKVFSETDPRENIVQYPFWYMTSGQAPNQAAGQAAGQSVGQASASVIADDDWRQVRLLAGQRQGKYVVVQLEGVTSREQAEGLRGQQIAVNRDQLPDLNAGEVYWTDLVGLAVINHQSVCLGVIDRLFETGANDVVVVKRGRFR